MPQTYHTPGPWIMHKVEHGHGRVIKWQVRANAQGNFGSEKFTITLSNEQDAALIAAAPEMLAMLQDVSTWLETNLKRGAINAGTANRNGDLVSQIRATIHHATGR